MSKAGSSGVSVMRADLDAVTSTSADAQEAQWRAGANRQAQPGAAAHQASAGAARQQAPDAHAQRLAASHAAAEARTRKRKAREAQEQLEALAFAASDDEDACSRDHQQKAQEAAADAWLQDAAAQNAAWDARARLVAAT